MDMVGIKAGIIWLWLLAFTCVCVCVCVNTDEMICAV